jgi:antitoxin HicB
MKEHRLAYPATFEKEGSDFLVSFRDIPWALTSGPTMRAAFLMAEDCLDVAVATLLEDGEKLPTPSRRRAGETLVPVPPMTAVKAVLVQAMQSQGISPNALARRMGKDGREVRRIIDPHHATKISTLTDALEELGWSATVVFGTTPTTAPATQKVKA